MNKRRVKLVCPHCGSEDVCCDASAAWSVEDQDWELCSTYDNRFCNECGWDGHALKEVPVEPLVAAIMDARATAQKEP